MSDSDIPGLVRLATERKVELVVVGPEIPLALGLADALKKAGVPCFGPSQAIATTLIRARGACGNIMIVRECTGCRAA